MITGLEVYSPYASLPTMGPSFSGIDDDFIQIRNIEGLNPVKATVNTSPYATLDGESYSGSFVGKRNIVITFGLNPDYNYYQTSGLRHLLYRYFMPKRTVTLRISSNDMPTVDISGIVEGVDPTIFAKDPEVQVSIICAQPDFIASEPTILTGLVGDGTVPEVIDYVGNIETGFVLSIGFADDVIVYEGPLRIIARSLLPETFSTTIDVDASNAFEMSSVVLQKYSRSIAILTGEITNQFNILDLDSQWPKLYPGENLFSVICEMPDSEGQIWKLTYSPRFWGL